MHKGAMQIVKHREEVMQNYFNYVLKWIFFLLLEESGKVLDVICLSVSDMLWREPGKAQYVVTLPTCSDLQRVTCVFSTISIF